MGSRRSYRQNGPSGVRSQVHRGTCANEFRQAEISSRRRQSNGSLSGLGMSAQTRRRNGFRSTSQHQCQHSLGPCPGQHISRCTSAFDENLGPEGYFNNHHCLGMGSSRVGSDRGLWRPNVPGIRGAHTFVDSDSASERLALVHRRAPVHWESLVGFDHHHGTGTTRLFISVFIAVKM